MPSKKSGGARQVIAKHLERDAKRPPGYANRSRASFRRAIRGKHGVEMAMAAAEWVINAAGSDLGPPPEQMREQVIRAAQVLGKLADPKRQLDERDAAIRAMAQDIEELEARVKGGGDAAQVDPADPIGGRAAAQH